MEHFGYAPLVNLHLSRIVNRERRRFLKRPMVELLNLCAKIPPFTPKPAHSSSKLPIVKVVNGVKVRRNQPQWSNIGLNVRPIQKPHGWSRFWSRDSDVGDRNLC